MGRSRGEIELMGPCQQEGRAALPLHVTRNKILKSYQDSFSVSLFSPHYTSSFVQTFFSIAISSSRICGQKEKISSCQPQYENPSEGTGWVMGPFLEQSFTVSSAVVVSPALWPREWGALRIAGRASKMKEFCIF